MIQLLDDVVVRSQGRVLLCHLSAIHKQRKHTPFGALSHGGIEVSFMAKRTFYDSIKEYPIGPESFRELDGYLKTFWHAPLPYFTLLALWWSSREMNAPVLKDRDGHSYEHLACLMNDSRRCLDHHTSAVHD